MGSFPACRDRSLSRTQNRQLTEWVLCTCVLYCTSVPSPVYCTNVQSRVLVLVHSTVPVYCTVLVYDDSHRGRASTKSVDAYTKSVYWTCTVLVDAYTKSVDAYTESVYWTCTVLMDAYTKPVDAYTKSVYLTWTVLVDKYTESVDAYTKSVYWRCTVLCTQRAKSTGTETPSRGLDMY